LLNYGFTQFFRQRALEKKIGVANLRKKKLITVNKLAANKSLIANAYYLRKGVAQKSCKFITKLTPLKVIHYNKYNSFPLKPVYITKQHLLFSRKNFTVKSLFLAKIAIIFKNFYQKFLKNTVNQLLRIKTKNFFNLYLLFVSANLGDYSNTNFVINHESRSLNESTKKTFTLYALHKVDLVAFKVLNFSNLNYIFNKSSSNYFNDSHSTKKKQNEMFFYKNLSFYHATALSLISLYLGDYNSTSTVSIQQLNQKTSRSLTTNYTTPQHFFKKRRVYRHSLSKLPTSSTAIYLNSNFEYLVNFLTSPVTFKYLFFCKLNQQFRVSTTAFFNSISCFRLYSKLNIFNKTNLLNKQNFSLKIYKKIIKISADKKFRLSTPATTLFSITNFLEHCSGKCVIINFNPFLLQFLTFVEVAQCYL
jgi:hypothetical protein